MNPGRFFEWRRAGVVLLLGLFFWLWVQLAPAVIAAPNLQFSPTPAPVVIPTMTAPAANALATETPTRTPTQAPPVQAEAIDGAVNVRAAPDIEAPRLGSINPGETYPILGRAEGTLWLRIQFPESPSGTGWVFEQVVNIIGDPAEIEVIPLSGEPTIDIGAVAGTQTVEALAQTPGALATATAQSFATGIVVGDVQAVTVVDLGPGPTFTYPADVTNLATPQIPRSGSAATQEGGLAPIIPIIGLTVLGGLGLLIGFLRRLG
ncbi:MAG: SH3 domain-containing protein [Anaerolineae bacterium]|nr:SH3 domain-containing protein [Anaerolineae bacterium]